MEAHIVKQCARVSQRKFCAMKPGASLARTRAICEKKNRLRIVEESIAMHRRIFFFLLPPLLIIIMFGMACITIRKGSSPFVKSHSIFIGVECSFLLVKVSVFSPIVYAKNTIHLTLHSWSLDGIRWRLFQFSHSWLVHLIQEYHIVASLFATL